MPRETFTHTATAAAGRDQVWTTLQKPKTWEGIAGVENVSEPVVAADGSLHGFSFESVIGGRTHKGQAKPSSREEQRLIAWDIETSDIAGSVSVKLDDQGTGTKIDVSLTVESRGILSSVFFGVISTTIGDGFPTTVENFAESLG